MSQYIVIVEGEAPDHYGPFRSEAAAQRAADKWNAYGNDVALVRELRNPANITADAKSDAWMLAESLRWEREAERRLS